MLGEVRPAENRFVVGLHHELASQAGIGRLNLELRVRIHHDSRHRAHDGGGKGDNSDVDRTRH